MPILSGQRLTPARLNPGLADLRQIVAQTIPNATWTPLVMGGEDIDTHAGHTNTSRYTCQAAGTYLLVGGAAFATNATGQRFCRWHLNAAEIAGSGSNCDPTTGNPTLLVARPALVMLDVGDYVELAAFQSSGAPLDTYISAGAVYAQSGMSVCRMGSA